MTNGAAERIGSKRVSAADPRFGEIVDFLTDEAALLDEDRYHEWLDLMADDISYRMPMRHTLYRRDGRGFDDRTCHFDDDKMTLSLRVKRSVDIPSAYDRDPAPRMRRLIANIVVHEGENEGEYAVTSVVTLLRNRLAATNYDLLSAQRQDVLRRVDGRFKIATRLILLDQAALGTTYLNVFL